MTADMTSPSELLFELPESKSFFSSDEITLLDSQNIPKHIAIIMDGNRRWAKQQGLPAIMGHWEGADVLTEVVRGASDLGVKTVTVYALSTENWTRPSQEIEALMNVFEISLLRKKDQMIKDGVRLDTIGDLSRLPERVQKAFQETKHATEHCKKINLVLALNYGSRDEIKRAFAKILKEKISPEQVTEDLIAKHLDTSPWGDPDLLIRTSGELRISNFLLWQISYAEIYVTEVLWPNFTPRHLYEAMLVFQRRKRRLGGGEV